MIPTSAASLEESNGTSAPPAFANRSGGSGETSALRSILTAVEIDIFWRQDFNEHARYPTGRVAVVSRGIQPRIVDGLPPSLGPVSVDRATSTRPHARSARSEQPRQFPRSPTIAIHLHRDPPPEEVIEVNDALRLVVDETREGAPQALEVESKGGDCVRIELRGAVPPGILDGLAPGEL